MSAGPGPAAAPERAHDDPGLQPERTSLAWGRTVVSFCAATAVLLRWMGHFGLPVLALIGLLVAAALTILGSQRRRYDRQAAGLEGGRIGANVWGVAVMAGVLAAFGLSAALLAVFD